MDRLVVILQNVELEWLFGLMPVSCAAWCDATHENWAALAQWARWAVLTVAAPCSAAILRQLAATVIRLDGKSASRTCDITVHERRSRRSVLVSRLHIIWLVGYAVRTLPFVWRTRTTVPTPMRIWPAILSIDSPVPRSRTTSSRLKIRRGRPIAFPVLVPCALAARMPALTRSRINSRSNCATAARMCIS